ncbi:MAG TPA: 4'-phosphopantetheinyl transferase superfamily protein [Trebonia sp.]|jgi:4'-phosphopantetheinyl transferase EntD|nr:4'-phosphopantetheinyl transferase superfamily protein [Trebonia sp.]
MIEQILPPGVAYGEAFADPPGAELFPEEAAIVARAVEKRRREFTTGRDCARTALRGLGFGPVPILAGERGAPQWPPGVVGTITHCRGYRAALAARQAEFLTVGLDAEPNDDLPGGVLDAVSRPAERERIGVLRETAPGVCWDRLLFCAKEAVYKAWFPLTRRWLGFKEADITFDAGGGTFDARLGTFDARLVTLDARLVTPATAGERPLTGFSGRWLARDGLIVVTIAVPRAPGSDAG